MVSSLTWDDHEFALGGIEVQMILYTYGSLMKDVCKEAGIEGCMEN